MVVAIDVRNLQGGSWSGVGVYTDNIIRSLLALNTPHKCILFSNSTSLDVPLRHAKTLTVHTRFPNIFFHGALRFFHHPFLDRIIERKTCKKPDIFFSPNLHFTALRTSVRHVITIHDLSFELYPEYFSLKHRLWHRLVQPKKQCERAAAIIVPSEHTKDDLIRLYRIDKEKIHVVYSGLPVPSAIKKYPDEVRKKYGLGNRFLLFMGTVEPRKNIDGMISAYKRSGLCEKGIDLVIAGSKGWKRDGVMKQVGATPGVRYVGYVDDGEKEVLFTKAVMCLFPSFYEGFGFPVLEAMRAGTPVITSDRSSLPEIADGAAYLVNPYDIGALAKGMQRLVDDSILRQQLIDRGHQVASTYSWDRAAEKMWDIFERVA